MNGTAKYHRLLVDKRAELESQLRKLDAIAIEDTPDELDKVQLAGEREFAISKLDRDTMLLGQVRRALQRIAGGDYGVCLECGQDINPKRLAAVPWAAYCLRCQEAQDQDGAGGRARDSDETLSDAA